MFIERLGGSRGEHFRFGFYLKKPTKPNFYFFLIQNWNRTETGSNRPFSVQFGSVNKGKKLKKPILSSYVSCEGHADANKWRRSMMNWLV